MNSQVDFFDSNILIAAVVEEHVHHQAANSRLGKLASARAGCSTHALAETYTTLTRFSKGYGRSPADALKIIEYARQTFTLVSLTPKETCLALESAARLGHRGAIIYDALLIACARKINARFIYTNDVGHFCQVAPDLTHSIREP